MTSGVGVSDSVIECINNMKVRKMCSKEEAMKRKKAVLFKLNDTCELIVIDEGKEILVGDIINGEISDPFSHFMNLLSPNKCSYALYDASFETKESKKEELIFIHWAPDSASVKEKMIFASSKNAVKDRLKGVKHEWQLNSMDDLLDITSLAAKLGSNVISVEMRPVPIQQQQQEQRLRF
ncbi:cofilin-2-like [Narcine bancroftii]|uniref:cofilin-2-like n=1 Tax=Narcine bancroftii TaxID=1343680 RepID=UPI003831BCB9